MRAGTRIFARRRQGFAQARLHHRPAAQPAHFSLSRKRHLPMAALDLVVLRHWPGFVAGLIPAESKPQPGKGPPARARTSPPPEASNDFYLDTRANNQAARNKEPARARPVPARAHQFLTRFVTRS